MQQVKFLELSNCDIKISGQTENLNVCHYDLKIKLWNSFLVSRNS